MMQTRTSKEILKIMVIIGIGIMKLFISLGFIIMTLFDNSLIEFIFALAMFAISIAYIVYGCITIAEKDYLKSNVKIYLYMKKASLLNVLYIISISIIGIISTETTYIDEFMRDVVGEAFILYILFVIVQITISIIKRTTVKNVLKIKSKINN